MNKRKNTPRWKCQKCKHNLKKRTNWPFGKKSERRNVYLTCRRCNSKKLVGENVRK